jgi:hypothetical protein
MNEQEIDLAVDEVLRSTPFIDIHTHVADPSFGKLSLWGIDGRLFHGTSSDGHKSVRIDAVPQPGKQRN